MFANKYSIDFANKYSIGFATLFSKAAKLFLKAYCIMMLLLKSLLIILIIICIYYGYINKFRPTTEGMTTAKEGTFTPTGTEKDPTFLAITNAANISILKGQVDDLLGLKETVNNLNTSVIELNKKVEKNTTGIVDLGQTLKNTTAQVIGRDPDSTKPLPPPISESDLKFK